MTAIGGPIQEVTIDGRLFPVAADADTTRDLGGFTNEVSPNGDGSARLLKTRIPWSIEGLTLQCDDAQADQEFLQNVSNSNDWTNAITIKFASGLVYQGKGTITDKVEFSSSKATASVKLGGPGQLTQQ